MDDTCPVCNTRLQDRDAVKEWGRPFLARYDGQCPGCNLPIKANVHRCVGDGRRLSFRAAATQETGHREAD